MLVAVSLIEKRAEDSCRQSLDFMVYFSMIYGCQAMLIGHVKMNSCGCLKDYYEIVFQFERILVYLHTLYENSGALNYNVVSKLRHSIVRP